MLQRVLAGIICHDPAGIDDDSLYLGALPEIAPPGDVISHGIFFRDIGLAPAARPAIPGLGGSGGSRRSTAGSGSERGGDELTSVGHWFKRYTSAPTA